eukprot:9488080-Pyramimonas_sp.AAC.1
MLMLIGGGDGDGCAHDAVDAAAAVVIGTAAAYGDAGHGEDHDYHIDRHDDGDNDGDDGMSMVTMIVMG